MYTLQIWLKTTSEEKNNIDFPFHMSHIYVSMFTKKSAKELKAEQQSMRELKMCWNCHERFIWRSCRCQSCYETKERYFIFNLNPTPLCCGRVVRARNGNGDFCRPVNGNMHSGRRVRYYLKQKYWQKYDAARDEWMPLQASPTHIVHKDQDMPAHLDDYIGLFDLEVFVIFSQLDEYDVSDKYAMQEELWRK